MTIKVKFLGHATFEIVSLEGSTIIIDPWYDNNPANPYKAEDVKEADVVLVTHYHQDHVEDAARIVKQTGATFIAQPEVASKLVEEEGLPRENVIHQIGMNSGGSVFINGIKFTMVQAVHSSEAGEPCGYIISLENKQMIYHAGDTGIFSSMELLGEIYGINLALLPIGNVFTMGPVQASFALNLLKPQAVIPMHYKTFPFLVQDAGEFKRLARLEDPEVEIAEMEPGDIYELK